MLVKTFCPNQCAGGSVRNINVEIVKISKRFYNEFWKIHGCSWMPFKSYTGNDELVQCVPGSSLWFYDQTRPKLAIFVPPRPKIRFFSDFADRGNMSATGTTGRKVGRGSQKIKRDGQKISRGVRKFSRGGQIINRGCRKNYSRMSQNLSRRSKN